MSRLRTIFVVTYGTFCLGKTGSCAAGVSGSRCELCVTYGTCLCGFAGCYSTGCMTVCGCNYCATYSTSLVCSTGCLNAGRVALSRRELFLTHSTFLCVCACSGCAGLVGRSSSLCFTAKRTGLGSRTCGIFPFMLTILVTAESDYKNDGDSCHNCTRCRYNNRLK